ncbi:PAS domain-containing protein [Microvirga brassicacearum]|uniref:PAS domain-containing protein n=1 Tax=Microvirga brassicacearum TaxID=2580413 RepID=A0A5N3P757_9HYPH|nr:PAS domain-containing protein [Microvirga brassicacearum]KAB0265515.1 PAS domain-containing protein [Microvirga brassicacearum]
MDQVIHKTLRDHRQLQQIIAVLDEGVILVDLDQRILWANTAALEMHGARVVDEPGQTAADYRERFELRYRNNHRLIEGNYPIDRAVAGETFSDMVVEVRRHQEADPEWVHSVSNLPIVNTSDEVELHVLVITDVTARYQDTCRGSLLSIQCAQRTRPPSLFRLECRMRRCWWSRMTTPCGITARRS